MADPDFIYDPEDWDATFDWGDRYEVSDRCEIEIGKARKFATLVKSTPVWCVNVVLSRDEDGDPDKTELQWFDNEEDAAKAVAASVMAS